MIKTMKALSYPFTHPEKLFYDDPRITKLQLAEYYQSVSGLILPYIAKRPLSIVRCPQGAGGECFFQKHINESKAPGLHSVIIKEKVGKEPYLYIKDEEGLMALVQLGSLETHIWGCHVDNVEKPDLITFDLDPAPGVEWKKVIETAFFIREELLKLGLTSFVKTSGGKGLHIMFPIKRQYGWQEIEVFTSTFVEYLVSLQPSLLLATMSKAKRKGKIFVDYFRNHRGATVVAPYSTRAKPNAAVSTPLSWDELSVRIKSDSFNIKTILTRLNKQKHDPWADFFEHPQKLKLPRVK